jgi:RNA polymerase sigma factor (sigma-70 family)
LIINKLNKYTRQQFVILFNFITTFLVQENLIKLTQNTIFVQDIRMSIIQNDFDKKIAGELLPLRNYALSLTHDMDDTKDLVQDTILKAYRYQSKFQEGTNLRGWLYTILKNSFINNYRRDMKRNTFLDSTDNSYFIDLPSHKIDNDAETKFIRQDLEAAIDELSFDLRVTFKLNTEGYKYHEIAEEMQIPIGTVKTRIFVARRILRERLKEYAVVYGLQMA